MARTKSHSYASITANERKEKASAFSFRVSSAPAPVCLSQGVCDHRLTLTSESWVIMRAALPKSSSLCTPTPAPAAAACAPLHQLRAAPRVGEFSRLANDLEHRQIGSYARVDNGVVWTPGGGASCLFYTNAGGPPPQPSRPQPTITLHTPHMHAQPLAAAAPQPRRPPRPPPAPRPRAHSWANWTRARLPAPRASPSRSPASTTWSPARSSRARWTALPATARAAEPWT